MAGSRVRLLVAGGVALAVVVVGLAVLIPSLADGSQEADGARQKDGTASIADLAGSLVVLAHQGGSETYPFETLPAFVAAAKAGVAIETDVHWTLDGVAVLVHDAIIPAKEVGNEYPMDCEGGPYSVSETTWDVLRSRCRTVASASKDGRRYPIPTYDAAMKAIAAVPGAEVVLEMKPEQPTADQIRDYLAAITKYGMAQRTVSSSFYPDALTRIQAQAKQDKLELRYLRMLRPSPGQDLPTPEQLSAQGLWGVALRSDIATHGNVSGLRAKKLAVVVWTVNTEQQWSAAKQAGADLVLTDRPIAYKAWLP